MHAPLTRPDLSESLRGPWITLQGSPLSGRSIGTNGQGRVLWKGWAGGSPETLPWAVSRVSRAPDPRTGEGRRQAPRRLPAFSMAQSLVPDGSASRGSNRWRLCDVAHPKAWVSWSGSCLSGAPLSGLASVGCCVPPMGPRRLPASRVFREIAPSFPGVFIPHTGCHVSNVVQGAPCVGSSAVGVREHPLPPSH